MTQTQTREQMVDRIIQERNQARAKIFVLVAALEKAKAGLDTGLVWMRPNLGGRRLYQSREAVEKILREVERALT
jgi:hypothetical protein